MELECGPSSDRRKLVLELPSYTGNLENPTLINLQTRLNKQKGNFRIGILVSGGLDSALLYYLLHKENHQTGNKFTITPYTILRKEGSKYHALDVINYINGLFDMPKTKLNIVGDNSLEEIQQVLSGQKDVLKTEDFAYIGVIEARPEHSIGWVRHGFIEKARVRYPLLNLQKSHIVDLICQNNLQELFDLTHSCAIHETDPCGYCNGCMERQWGLDQMNVTDYK